MIFLFDIDDFLFHIDDFLFDIDDFLFDFSGFITWNEFHVQFLVALGNSEADARKVADDLGASELEAKGTCACAEGGLIIDRVLGCWVGI